MIVAVHPTLPIAFSILRSCSRSRAALGVSQVRGSSRVMGRGRLDLLAGWTLYLFQ